MQTRWIATNEVYHTIIQEQDEERRRQLFEETFLEPFRPWMEQRILPMLGPEATLWDGARMWGWLLPEHLTQIPDSLQQLEAADAWEQAATALEESAARFAPYAEQLAGLPEVAGWLVVADPAQAGPLSHGYTGAQFPGQIIAQFYEANAYNLPRIPLLIAHEFHHIVRGTVFPWHNIQAVTVAEYVVLEGMAESFATARYGKDLAGYFVTDLHEAQVATARGMIGEALEATGFDVIRGYIFGDLPDTRFHMPKTGMPPYGGYAVGYHVVQAYLRRTGKSVEEATFVPADEIVRESGYFDAVTEGKRIGA